MQERRLLCIRCVESSIQARKGAAWAYINNIRQHRTRYSCENVSKQQKQALTLREGEDQTTPIYKESTFSKQFRYVKPFSSVKIRYHHPNTDGKPRPELPSRFRIATPSLGAYKSSQSLIEEQQLQGAPLG